MFYKQMYAVAIGLALMLAGCNDKTELVLEKAKLTIETQAILKKNVAHISGKVTLHNPNNQKLDVGFTYSSTVKKPQASMASFEYVKRQVQQSFDFKDFKIALTYAKTYYVRGFATDGKTTIYGKVFKIVVGKKSAIGLDSPGEDESGVGVTPTFRWSYNKSTPFSLFLKKEGETDFQKMADNITGTSQNKFSWTPSTPLDRDKRYQWYVITEEADALKSDVADFDTFNLTGTLQTFDQPVLGYQEDSAGNQYIVLDTRYDKQFGGKQYHNTATILVKRDKNGSILAVRALGATNLNAFWVYGGYDSFKFLKDNSDHFYLIFLTERYASYYHNTDLTTNPSQHVVVAKLNADLQLLWHKTLDGLGIRSLGSNNVISVASDVNGNGEVICAIGFEFENNTKTLLGKQYTAMGNQDIFVFKLDANGRVVFQKFFGTKGKDIVRGVALGSLGKATLVVGLGADKTTASVPWYESKVTDTRSNKQIGTLQPTEKHTTFHLLTNGGYSYYHEPFREVEAIKIDTAGNLYEFGKVTGGSLTIQSKTLSVAQGYYMAKFSYSFSRRITNAPPGLISAKPIRTDDRASLQMEMLDDKPYIVGYVKSMDGLGESFRSPVVCFFTAQVGSYLNINWIKKYQGNPKNCAQVQF